MNGVSRKLAIALLLVAASVLAAVFHWRSGNVRDRMMRADPETILAQPALADAALSIGKSGFEAHCATCHGSGAADPARGVPDLTDGDYLYGHGDVAEIEQIVLHGIRSGDPRGWNLASMPAYSREKPYAAEPIPPLKPDEIRDVAQYLLQRHGRATDPVSADRGAKLYAGNGGCWDCHAVDGAGDDAVGAPNLVDDVWLYGDGSLASISSSIAHGHAGISPAFARKLSPSDARAIAVYVASLSQHRSKEPARD